MNRSDQIWRRIREIRGELDELLAELGACESPTCPEHARPRLAVIQGGAR